MTRTSLAKPERAFPPSAALPIARTLPAGASSRLSLYLDLLAKWNRVYNLTAIRERSQMQLLHVEDALAVLPWLPADSRLRVLDIGSGGGIPGIPLAIARPDWHVVLLDANGKKASFLTQAVIELALDNVTVVAARIEEHPRRETYNILISRAFSDLRGFALAAVPHLAPDGVIVAMKAALPLDEIEALPRDIAVVATPALRIPGLDAQRHLVIMQAKGKPS
jgi:16S rRNA (guanine527-N7)-methyltransferase